MMEIKFWGAKNKNGFLSNFYPSPFFVNGVRYPTVEHYFQSKKFEGTEYEEYIRNLPTPAETAQQGKRRDLPLRKDWEEVKEDVMMTGLRAKFKQSKRLASLLLATESAILVEDSPYDYYWGIGFKGTGKNRLGVLLMKLRLEVYANTLASKEKYEQRIKDLEFQKQQAQQILDEINKQLGE